MIEGSIGIRTRFGYCGLRECDTFCQVNLTLGRFLDMFIRDKQNTVENTVREARTVLALTQEELAEQVHATRQTIISIEKGNYVPSVLLALKIATVLGRKVEDLFKVSNYEKI